jgi:hypothetical protein
VASFCQRLLTIEYIDLAEQSLQALEKLSHEHSPALLQQGGLLAVRIPGCRTGCSSRQLVLEHAS